MSVARGVLVGVLLIVVLALLFVWFALPPILGGVAVGILRDNGLRAGDIRVEVAADPPLRLIGLTADRVRVRATDVAIENLTAESVDLTLRDVSLRAQTFASIEGRLDGASITPREGAAISVTSVQISGSPDATLMTMSLSEAQVGSLVRSTIARSLGADARDVNLDAPDRLTFDLQGEPVGGRLRVDEAGTLVFTEDRDTLTLELFRSDPGEPVALRNVRVQGETLEVTGTVDLLEAR